MASLGQHDLEIEAFNKGKIYLSSMRSFSYLSFHYIYAYIQGVTSVDLVIITTLPGSSFPVRSQMCMWHELGYTVIHSFIHSYRSTKWHHLMLIIIILIINMLIVHYPMQFSGPPRNISNPCSAPLCAGEWWFN